MQPEATMQRVLMGVFAYSVVVPVALAVQMPRSTDVEAGSISNLAGESFDVNQPGDHLLLRMPLDTLQPALIEVRADMVAADDEPCNVYTQNITIFGEWLEKKIVHVKSQGGFALKLSSSEHAGAWQSPKEFTSGPDVLANTVKVKVAPASQEGEAADEGRGLALLVGPKLVHKRPTIEVTLSPRGGLDVTLTKLRRLDAEELGGLLGTQKHKDEFSTLTDLCMASMARAPSDDGVSDDMAADLVSVPRVPRSSRLSSSWY